MQRPLSPQRHQLIDNFKVYNGMDAEPYRRTLEAIPQTIESVRARIGEIIIYPIKGMQGIYLEEALLTEKGLTTLDGCCRDRQAMLARIDPATGERVRFSGKDNEHIGKLQVEFDPNKEEIEITAPGTYITSVVFSAEELWPEHYDPVRIKLETAEIIQGVVVEDKRFDTIEAMLQVYGDKTGRSNTSGKIQLVIPHIDSPRYSDTSQGQDANYQTNFSDGAQLHITNQETLDWLNEGLKEVNGNDYRTLPMESFRPNIVLRDAPANIEDIAQKICFEQQEKIINLVRLTPRCKVPQRDLKTGQVVDGEPLPWLRTHRPRREKGQPTFGVNAHAEPASHAKVISAGDKIWFDGERRNY